MMAQTRLEGDLFVTGTIGCTSLAIPTGTVNNAAISGSAGIASDKLEHRHRITHSQADGSDAATESRVIHVVRGTTGTVNSFVAGMTVANASTATVTFDLHKNGSSMLSAAVSLTSSHSAYELVAGTLSATSLAQDDVLEIVITATAGGGTLGDGPFATVELDEDAS